MSSLDNLENTLKSKAVLELLEAFRVYQELIENGWPPDKAFQVAFMGVQLIFIPGMKPLPEPDPPFSLPALYQAVKEAHSHVSSLKESIEADLAFLEAFMNKQS
jgi:hypothetical protein